MAPEVVPQAPELGLPALGDTFELVVPRGPVPEPRVHQAEPGSALMRLEGELHRDPRGLALARRKRAALGVVRARVVLHQTKQAPGLPGVDARCPLPTLSPRPHHRTARARRDLRVEREPAHQLLRLGERAPHVVARGVDVEGHLERAGLVGVGCRLFHGLSLGLSLCVILSEATELTPAPGSCRLAQDDSDSDSDSASDSDSNLRLDLPAGLAPRSSPAAGCTAASSRNRRPPGARSSWYLAARRATA